MLLRIRSAHLRMVQETPLFKDCAFKCEGIFCAVYDLAQSRTQSLQAFWSAGQRREDSGDIAISYPESSGFLVRGATPGRLWGHRKNSIFLIGCSVTVSIVLPQKSCGNKNRCPQSLHGVAPLTKKPEDSGYEIRDIEKIQFFLIGCSVTVSIVLPVIKFDVPRVFPALPR